MSTGFNASCFQIRIGYTILRGSPLPGDLPFSTAAAGLVRDFGIDRVQAVLTAIPNNPDISEEAAIAAGRDAAFRYAVDVELSRHGKPLGNRAAFAEHCRAARAAGRSVADTAATWSA
jgi:hypothetical protein